MLSPLQAWTAAHSLLAAVVAVGASIALRRRPVGPDARGAALALRVFWAGLGATALVQLGMLLAATEGVGRATAIATVLLAYATSVAALGALAAYFAFVFTGARTAVPAVAALYVLVLALGSWGLVQAEPIGLALSRWNVDPEYTRDPSGWLAAGPAVAALVPAIGGALAFLVLGLRSTGVTRKRGILVGSALLLWFGATLAVSAGASGSDAAQVARKLGSTAGIAAVYLAYLSPRPLRERWGLAHLADAADARPPAAPHAPRLSPAMERRLRELI